MVKKAVLNATLLLFVTVSAQHGTNGDSEGKTDADLCRAYDNCPSCTNARYHRRHDIDDDGESVLTRRLWPHRCPTCIWCPLDKSCRAKNNSHTCHTNASMAIPYEYDCPAPYPPSPPELLGDWMGALWEATDGLCNVTLVDLSLPGTHDSLTYDLSLQVSDDGLDSYEKLADLLHFLSGHSIMPGEIEEFFRLQAKTQQLTVSQQLDNGIRFLDIRIMMEHDSKEWYSIHFMQSKSRVEVYLNEIRDWLDLHPREIVVLWLSRHGDLSATGDNQYPGVDPADKQRFFQLYIQVFEGLLLDSRVSTIYATSITDLLKRNHRVVTFAADYAQFTAESPFALDASNIQNYFSEQGVFDEGPTRKSQEEYFHNATANNAAMHARSKFTLMSMNTPGPPWQLVDAAKNRFLPFDWFGSSCASKANIPGMSRWCPETLLDIAQLTSFYNQIPIENAWKQMHTYGRIAFPNAFYLDALDYDGTIRTGTQLLDGAERSAEHKLERYSYVDTVLAYNLRKVCKSIPASRVRRKNHTCKSLSQTINQRRDTYPLKIWDDASYGRLANWPLNIAGIDALLEKEIKGTDSHAFFYYLVDTLRFAKEMALHQ